MLDLKIKLLSEIAKLPKYTKSGDAGLDLIATSKTIDYENHTMVYGTGLSVEIPEGHYGQLVPRSSIARTNLTIVNSPGTIDSGYRGEIKVIFAPTVKEGVRYQIGDKIAQLVILPYPKINIIEVDELSESERGESGFGSSGA